MARIIYPINDKRYTAEDVEIYNIPRTSGVYAVLDFDCSLSGDTLTIGKGLAWIKNGEFSGKTVAFTEPETLTLEYADDTYDRYDVVAIRYDATKTEPELIIKKGVASASPELPARSTETYLYELYLYSILREKGEPFPLFANITDLRRDTEYCGIMRDSVTSVVDVMRETLYEDENGAGQLDLISAGGMTLEPEEYGSLIATIKYGNVSVDMPLYKVNTTSRSWVFAGETKTPSNGTFTIELQPVSGGFSVETATQDSGSSPQNAKITKLVGIPEKSQGYVAVDSLYNPESHNAQSGEAVKQAIDEALEGFEIPDMPDANDTELRKELEQAIGVVSVTSDPEVLEIPRIDGYCYDKRSTEYTDGDGKTSMPNSQCTELVSVTAGQKFFVTGQYGYLCCLIIELDENRNFIQSIGTTEKGTQIATDFEYTVPNGVSYVGFSTRNATIQPLIVKGSAVTETTFRNIGNDVDILTEDVTELKETVEGLESGSGIESLVADVDKIKTWGVVGKNLYNPEKDTFGSRADGGGNVSLGLRNSEWIAVEPNANYVLSNDYEKTIAVVIALKNNDDTISVVENAYNLEGGAGYLITTTETTTHIRFSTYTNSANDLMRDYIMLEKGKIKTAYEPFKYILDYKNRLPQDMENPWYRKQMVVDGDSITHDFDRNYWQFASSNILGMVIDDKRQLATENNLFAGTQGWAGCGWRGIGGSTISDSYLLNAVFLNDLTLDIGALTPEQIAEYEATYKANEGDDYDRHRADTGIVLRYQNYPDDADIILIAGGTNDWAHSVTKLGDFDSTDITTFNGALNTLLPALKEKYPDIPVVMMTPIKRGTYGAVNKLGYTQEDFVDALIKKCRQYNVYCLDMWANCPINPNIQSMVDKFYTRTIEGGGKDLVHPNADGHLVMGKTVAGFIRTLD